MVMMMNNSLTTEDLQDRFVSIIDAIIHLRREQSSLRTIISDLESQPITNANEHWRADRNGENTILELLHSTDSAYFKETGRRREYIGKDPAKIAAAREARQRHNALVRAKGHLQTAADKERGIMRYFERLEYFALGQQKSFVGEDRGDAWGHSENSGDNSGPASAAGSRRVSPQDMSPQEIADYFKSSETLRHHYDDLRKVPAFSEVNFNRG